MSNPTQSWQPQHVNPYAAPKIQKSVRLPGARDPLGGRGERLGAVIIDSLIFTPAILPIFVGSSVSPDSATLWMLVGVFFYLVIGVTQIVFLVKFSATLGKKALRLYIADFETGVPASWVSTILLRAIVNGVICAIPFIGSFYGLIDTLFIFRTDRRCIHDLIAKTVVLKQP